MGKDHPNRRPPRDATGREPDVCVVVAAYNAERTVGRAVRSALDQRHVSSVVVVDDASSDATAAAAAAADDGTGRLLVIRLLVNRGPAAARNTAIAATTTSHIALLDADDYYLPGRIERLMAMRDGDWDFAADNLLIVPERMACNPLPAQPSEEGRLPFVLDLATFVLGNLTSRTGHRRELGFLKPVMRRAFLVAHGLRLDATMRLGEDYALYVHALAAGARFVVTPVAGYVAVEREGSLSGRHHAGDLARIADLDASVARNCRHLTSAERSAIAAHRAATLRKAVHGEVIDLRRRHGYPAAVLRLLRSPGAIPLVLVEKLRSMFARRSSSPPDPVVRMLFDPRSSAGVPVTKTGKSGGEILGQPGKPLAAVPSRAVP